MIDMDAIYRKHTDPTFFSMMDPLHPTQEGHDLEAAALYEQLVSDGLVHAD